jgi:hypothetical protein
MLFTIFQIIATLIFLDKAENSPTLKTAMFKASVLTIIVLVNSLFSLHGLFFWTSNQVETFKEVKEQLQ